MADSAPSGSGGPFQVAGQAREGSLLISGGVGGISVQLEELAAGARKLDDLAAMLGAVEAEMHRIWEDLGGYRNEPWPTGTAALSSVWEAKGSVQAARAGLQHVSGQIRACVRDYETAEWWADVGRFTGYLSLADLQDTQSNIATTGVLDRRAMEWLVSQAGMEHAVLKQGMAGGPAQANLGSLLGAFTPRPLELRQEETVPVDLDSSPTGLLERIRAIDARGAGFIEVIEVDNGGQPSYVVVVPGTQAAGVQAGGSNPFDEAGIIEGLFHGSAEVNAGVLAALKAAGAEKGVPVVAVGYSQGGIHAMNLAADPRLLKEYELRYVLTAGSPVAGIIPEGGIDSLHLEHVTDGVTGTDGEPNPATRDRVTVSLSHSLRTGEGGILGDGHALTNYQEGARLVSASADPSLVHSTAVLAGVLGAGGAATATRFSLSRQEAPEAPRGRVRDRRGPFTPRPQQGAR